jgi:ParB-like chromosome segregation protein Spo0J
MKIKAGDNVRRGDLFYIDPYQIKVREDLRGRHKPPTDEDVISMAESMLDFGQIEPVEARRLPDQTLELNLGFTRTAAARLIREGFKVQTDDGEVERHDADFMLQVKVVDCNDQTAFTRNVVENCHRNMTSPMDDAFNQDRLRNLYGYNDVAIARLYGYPNSSKVSRLHKLLSLDRKVQDLVHAGPQDGGMSVQAALDLLELPADQREEAVKTATANGKVSGAEIRSIVRAHHLSDDKTEETPAAPAADGTVEDLSFLGNDTLPVTVPTTKAGKEKTNGKEQKGKARTMREVRVFFDHLQDEEGTDANIARFCESMVKFTNGTISDKQMVNALDRLLDAKRGK